MPVVIPPINISEFTKDVVKEDIKHTVSGEGIFDELMETATKHLQAQFEGNRIRGEMYAQAYIQIYIETLKAAMQIWLQKPLNDKQVEVADKELELKDKDLELKDKQLDLLAKQLELLESQKKSEDAKIALYRRQIEGYDENYKEKILKIVLDAFTVVFSVASEGFRGGLPKIITVSGINKICDIITKDLNLVAVNDPNNSNYVEKIRNGNVTINDSASTSGFKNG